MTDDAAIVKAKPKKHFDPDHYRMTIGEHLEELRIRLILALMGAGLVGVVCLIFGQRVMAYFCRPLIQVLMESQINPQIYFTEASDPFMVYIKISLISAVAVSSPWIMYQFWQFVAAGLYAHEKRIVTRYMPLSIILLVSGLVFVYFLVLPWTLRFFLAFSIDIPLPVAYSSGDTVPSTQPTMVEMLEGDPAAPTIGQIWYNRLDGRLKFFIADKVRVVSFGAENLTSPMITLPTYIDLVFGMLLMFGLSFQLPLAVMALVAIGIVERHTLKTSRRYVYFALAILAAIITPGDLVTATVALMIPLIGLFELGIWLSRSVEPEEFDDSPAT